MSPMQWDCEVPAEIADDLELLDAVATWDPISAIDKAPTVDAAAALCKQVQAARKALGLAEDELARFINDVVPYGAKVVVDGAVFEVKAGSQRQAWEHDDLKRRVAGEIAARLSEVIDDYQVAKVLEAWTAACGFQWKVTGLRALEIEPDDFCTKRPGVPRFVPLS